MLKRTIVAALISSNDNCLLFGRKDPQRGGVYLDKWHIPGGGVEEGESLTEALIREVGEETSIDVSAIDVGKPIKLEPMLTTKKLSDGLNVPCQMNFFVFPIQLSDNHEDIVAQAGDDFNQLKWIKKSELANHPHTPPSLSLFLRLGLMTFEDALPQRPFRNADQQPISYDGSPVSWRVSAYALVIKDESVLIIKNRKEVLHDVIGGGIEMGETVEDALHREAMEEGGAEIKIGELIHTSFDWFYHMRGTFHQTVQMFYLATLVGELQTPTEDDIEWVKFVPLSDIAQFPLPTAVQIALAKFLEKKTRTTPDISL